MSTGIYKAGQGYYTRVFSGIGFGLLVLMGGWWVWDNLRNVEMFGLNPNYTSAGAAVIVVAILGALGYWLIALKARTVDFLVATEAEMKKVNWSTRREVVGSTIVVIFAALLIGLICFVLDLGFSFAMRSVGVLEQAESVLLAF